jgi:hypothetical protein
MLVSSILPFALLGFATAAPSPTLIQRDLSTFTAAFSAVGSAISDFDTSVIALTPTSDIPTAITDLTAKSNAILDALNTGATNINASAVLSLTDSLSLLNLSNQLVATTNTTINDLISKKSIIDAANEDAFVVTQLNAVKSATYGFIGAIVSHVPSAVQSIAQSQANQVITVLNSGITAFGGTVSKVKRTLVSQVGAVAVDVGA